MTGPLETEDQARSLPEVRAVYDAFDRDPGAGKMAPHNYLMLVRACETAGVDLGSASSYDRRILAWLSGWEPTTCAVLAGIISRAATRAAVPPMSDHAFIRPGQVAPHLPAPDACMRCGRTEAGHDSTDSQAARQAAAAVLADFRREVDAFCDDDTYQSPEPDAITWAQRLAAALRSVLDVAGDQAATLDVARDALLDEPEPSVQQLAAIRAVFDVFDWDTDDRQYALEQIEDIVRGQS